MRRISEDERAALKAASRLSIRNAGGGDSFEHVTRIKAPRLSRCVSVSADTADDFLPLDVALEADREAGAPIIIEQMARMLGFRLVQAADVVPGGGIPSHRDILALDAAWEKLKREIFDAVDDGVVDAGEQRAVSREGEAVIRDVRQMMKRMGASV